MDEKQFLENWKSIQKELNNNESELIELISKTDNQELFDKFFEWQSKRNSANKMYLEFLNKTIYYYQNDDRWSKTTIERELDKLKPENV